MSCVHRRHKHIFGSMKSNIRIPSWGEVPEWWNGLDSTNRQCEADKVKAPLWPAERRARDGEAGTQAKQDCEAQRPICPHAVRPEGEVQGCTDSIPPRIRKRANLGPKKNRICSPSEERCRSGRTGLTRNQEYGYPYRGFESHPLRQFTNIVGPLRTHQDQ